jgi:hypothetical protein
MHAERRTEPFWRPYTDALLREPCAAVLQALINLGRPNDGAELGEERYLPGEDEALDSIIQDMGEYMRRKYRPGEFERVGNTKTHGLVRGHVTVRDDLPQELRQGIFKELRSYPAWIRFSGPGPDSPPDIEDVGFMSMTIKLMDVPGPKLLDDEKFTQDLLGVCTPTFVTPDVLANAELQAQLLKRTPLYYFFDPRQSHVLDFLMQSLWNETQTSPLECRYYSCTPYLLGQGRAMLYSMRPRTTVRSKIADLPRRPPDNYLRDNMIATLSEQDVVFDLLLQIQTDPHAMPIENAAVRWPESLSPFIPAATIHIPAQRFDSPEQLRFASRLSYTPWHCIPDHRPLGNQNRARRRMYYELSRLRFSKNQVAHYEPNGNEVFDDYPKAAAVVEAPSPRHEDAGRVSSAPEKKPAARRFVSPLSALNRVRAMFEGASSTSAR